MMILPDIQRDTAVEAWQNGSFYLMPAMSKYIQVIERLDPMTTVTIGLGVLPMSLPAGSLIISSRIFGRNIPEYFHQIGFEITSSGAYMNNKILEEMLKKTGYQEFQTQGWINGLHKFQQQLLESITLQPIEFPIPYRPFDIVTLDMSKMTPLEKFQYTMYWTDMKWIEEELNTAARRLPFLTPFLDGTFVAYGAINQAYGDYILNRQNAPLQSKQFAKVMFSADADIYTSFWRALYDNAPEFRNPQFINGFNKMGDLLVEAAYETGA